MQCAGNEQLPKNYCKYIYAFILCWLASLIAGLITLIIKYIYTYLHTYVCACNQTTNFLKQ